MSKENVETAVAAFERLAAGDLEGLLALATDDIEWRPAQVTRPFVGKAGVVRALEEWSEAWEDWRLELLDTIEGPGDEVVLVQRTWAKARGSGIVVEQQYYGVCTIRDGKLARMDQISNRAETFAASGLDPGAG